MLFDINTEFGQRVARRLRDDLILWFTTVRSDGTPQPIPVWFLWDEQEETLRLYSLPNARKLRNIAQNPKVAFNFDSDRVGGDIIVLTGEAALDEQAPPPNEVPEYVEKYREGMKRINMKPDEFAVAFPVALKVRITRVHGH